jgi:hypothetical protein
MTTPAHATTRVLARGLAERRFCRALLARRVPRLPADERLAAAAVDAERLALFAGFITKVRHSDLFEHIPGTLALLRIHGAELAVFRDYYLAHDPQPRGDTRAKMVAMLAHLADFAATRRGRAIVGLRDVLAHERCLWEIRQALAAPQPSTSATGPVRIARLLRDPYAVIADAQRGTRSTAERRVRWWLYLARASEGELRTIEVDREIATTLAAISTNSPPPRMSRRRRAAIMSHLREAGVLR